MIDKETVKKTINSCFSWFMFFFHRFPLSCFRPQCWKTNVRFLLRIPYGAQPSLHMDGTLSTQIDRVMRLLQRYFPEAYRKRLEESVVRSFIVWSLEWHNPTQPSLFFFFFKKKLALLKTMERLWPDLSVFSTHRKIYEMHSYVQKRLLQRNQQAARKQPSTRGNWRDLLSRGTFAQLVDRGAGGTYTIHDLDGRPLGIFKPYDEEYLAKKNPKSNFQGSLGHRRGRLGQLTGTAALHEVGAYEVDRFFGFGLIPHTAYIHVRKGHLTQEILGSFQVYIPDAIPLSLLSPTQVELLPWEEIQSLLLLDLLIGNMDRHAHNILIANNELIAIDHGFSFPDQITDEITYSFALLTPWRSRSFDTQYRDWIVQAPYSTLYTYLRKRGLLTYPEQKRMEERIAMLTAFILEGYPLAYLPHAFEPQALSTITSTDHQGRCAQAQRLVRDLVYKVG